MGLCLWVPFEKSINPIHKDVIPRISHWVTMYLSILVPESCNGPRFESLKLNLYHFSNKDSWNKDIIPNMAIADLFLIN